MQLGQGRSQANNPDQVGQPEQARSFEQTIKDSLSKVNEMQNEKSTMVTEFAAGKSQNVHELMISMQKASTAMQMTTAVRGKVLEAYNEIMNMPV